MHERFVVGFGYQGTGGNGGGAPVAVTVHRSVKRGVRAVVAGGEGPGMIPVQGPCLLAEFLDTLSRWDSAREPKPIRALFSVVQVWRRERDSKGARFAPNANKANDLSDLARIRSNR